jgi:D-beta-D-heptose 7-phosphate kinase/D-beta-D-heptose 1-phosphate adenosyltransferase
VVVDPKGRDFARYAGASVLTPNTSEVSVATGLPCTSDAEATAAAGAALAQAQAEHLLLTRSEKGMMLLDRQGEALFLRAQAREVFDVSGAGDTAVASLALALGAGAGMAGAAAIANAAAGIVVGKLGTAVVHASELAAALLSDGAEDGPSAKVKDLPAARDRAAQWQAAGLRVGFTNGCFDLLHPGHVALLRQARAACDRLVVGLNTDASIKRIKSPERPIQPEEARAAVLASLADVDLVVLFDEDTPIRLIEALRPDVLLKGADYRLDQVVGAEIVQGYGGEVVLVPLKEGHSTTNVVARIRTVRDGVARLAE